MIKKHKKGFVFFIIFFCLAMLVWVAGKTYETDKGLWMGYRWYPIVSSEKEKEEILYSSASIEQMKKITDYIDEVTGRSYWEPGEEKKTIVDINKIAPIKGFRKFLYNENPCLYCVYENQSGGRLFVTFEPYIDMNYFSSSYFYYENKLSSEDVNAIKIASNRQEVFAIDPIESAEINNFIDGEYMETSKQQSVHITDDGYIKVEYDSDGRVLEVTEQKSAMIRMILEMEQKGITINFYDVPDDVDSELEKQSREIGFYAEIGKKINPIITEEIDISQKGVEMLQEQFASEMTKGDDASCYFYRKSDGNKITFYKNNAIKVCETSIEEELAKDKFFITKFAKYGEKFFVELYSDKKNESMLSTIDIKTGKWGNKIRTKDSYDRVIIYKNCFYCFFRADFTIYSIDGSVDDITIQREDETKVVDVQFIMDDRIYYSEWYYSQKTVKIRRCNLDGKDAETLFQYRCNEGTEGGFGYGALKVDEKYLYILAPYGNATLSRIPLYGGEIEGIASTNWFDLSEESIFYLGDKNYIYKVNKDLKEEPIVVTELNSKEALIPFLYADNHLMVEGYDEKDWKIINEIWDLDDGELGFDIVRDYANDYYWVSETGEIEDEIKGVGLKKEYYDLFDEDKK